MEKTPIKDLKYDDFPLKLFWRLLMRPDAVAIRVVGNEKKWERFKQNWENDNSSIESENQLEQQKKVSLAFIQGQKAALTIKWLALTEQDPRPAIEALGYKWHEDPKQMIAYLNKIVNKSISKYENESAILENQKGTDDGEEGEKIDFNIDEAIASLDMMGFTIDDHETITIGRYRAMSKVAERKLNATKKEI